VSGAEGAGGGEEGGVRRGGRGRRVGARKKMLEEGVRVTQILISHVPLVDNNLIIQSTIHFSHIICAS
jgi:hypothetical protein